VPWPKSLLAQIAAFAVAVGVLAPLAAPGAAHHIASKIALGVILTYGIPILLAHWVAADMRQRGLKPPYELPFFLMLVWPISLFWYCAWTRGPEGLGLALGLVALSWLPTVITLIVIAAWMGVLA
jgi:hypothetical protein